MQPSTSRIESKFKSWWQRVATRFGLRLGPGVKDAEFPAYLTCPYCSEPEVEIWDCEKARCHNCGQVFTCDQARESNSHR